MQLLIAKSRDGDSLLRSIYLCEVIQTQKQKTVLNPRTKGILKSKMNSIIPGCRYVDD